MVRVRVYRHLIDTDYNMVVFGKRIIFIIDEIKPYEVLDSKRWYYLGAFNLSIEFLRGIGWNSDNNFLELEIMGYKTWL